MHFTGEAWDQLWKECGLHGESHLWFTELQKRYSEPHRHYHNVHHIDECLAELKPVRSRAAKPGALTFAIWFHDAVYDPARNDNEEQSAALALSCLNPAGFPETQLVLDLILATKTHVANTIPDGSLLLDIDLSILGRSPGRFAEYEAGIRAEYAFVPAAIYAGKRAAILRHFLLRPRIFVTDLFFERFEAQARTNLSRSIAALEKEH